MNYEETLDYLFSQLPIYQREGKAAYKANLDNTLKLDQYLNHPHQSFKSVHIGGTNGKGSSSHMLASILQEAGYKVGLYTSPHLKDFRERIKINGENIPREYVTRFVAEHKDTFANWHLSFFEWTVGLCFDYFRSEKVDIGIIEVGLGGRLDSTNIISPLACLITNIGIDHQQFLGDTKPKIASEKAGIIKPNTPIVISETQSETSPIFLAKAKEQNTEIKFADQTVQKTYASDLLGSYQKINQCGVLALIPYLKENGFTISKLHIESGLKNVVKTTGLLGRWQVLSESPKTICDTAHNKEGLGYVLKQLDETPKNKLHLVLGFVNDKDVANILALFPKNATYYLCEPAIPRRLKLETLTDIAKTQNLRFHSFDSVQKALSKAKENAESEDVIFIGGSTFVVAEVV